MGEESGALFTLVELLARRHALPIVWELRGGAQPFTALFGAVRAPENVASQRLRELRDAGLVEVDEGGDYRLTTHGRRLLGPIEALSEFAAGWAKLSARQRVPRGAADKGRGQN